MPPGEVGPMVLVTEHPERISREALSGMDVVLAVGERPGETLNACASALGLPSPLMPRQEPSSGEVVGWFRKGSDTAEVVRVASARGA